MRKISSLSGMMSTFPVLAVVFAVLSFPVASQEESELYTLEFYTSCNTVIYNCEKNVAIV